MAIAPGLAEVRTAGLNVFAYGNFITEVINFIILAFAVFLVIKLMNEAKKRTEKKAAEAPAAPAAPPADVVLLTEIRDLLKRQ